MKTSKGLRKKWLVYALSGILLMGFGLSVLGESNFAKASGESFIYWFLQGTGGLVLFFSGLSIFGQAVVFKGILDKEK